MRSQLETFKTLFEQVRGLGIVMQLPNDQHTQLAKNISVYFAENYNVTSITFGDHYDQQVEIMKYSIRDNSYKVSFPIDITDEQLIELIERVKVGFMTVKFEYLDSEIEKHRAATELLESEREEVVA